MNVGFKVVCDSIDPNEMDSQNIFGDEASNAHLVLRSSANEQLLYLDGATGGNEPIFVGLSKSRGDQTNKLPVEPGDALGGLQVYGRTKSGTSLGYCHDESPLTGAIQFFVSDDYDKSGTVSSDLIVALSDNQGMSVKLKVDSKGNLITQGNITSGVLTVTDTITENVGTIEKFIEVYHEGKKYAMPLYWIDND